MNDTLAFEFGTFHQGSNHLIGRIFGRENVGARIHNLDHHDRVIILMMSLLLLLLLLVCLVLLWLVLLYSFQFMNKGGL